MDKSHYGTESNEIERQWSFHNCISWFFVGTQKGICSICFSFCMVVAHMPGFRLIFGRFTWDNRATVSIFCVSFVMKSKIGLRIRELDGKMGGIQLSNRVYGCAHISHRTHTRLSGSCGVQHQHATSASQSINITHHRFSIKSANPGQTFRRTPQEFELITVKRHKQNHEPNQRYKLKAFVIWLYKNVCVLLVAKMSFYRS